MTLIDYFYWHFSVAPGNIWGILGNYMKATWHRFLIVQHLKTLFAPWHRQQPSEFGEAKTFASRIGDAIADFYIRIIAAAVRLTIILTGLFVEAIIFIAFVLLMIIWILWPFVFLYSVSRGLILIF